MHTKVMAIAGTAVVVLAISVSAGADHWLETRTFKPVNMPVELGAKIIRTDAFEINLRETYSVYVDMDYIIKDYEQDQCNYKNLWGSHWKAYRLAGEGQKSTKVWASSEDRNRSQGDNQEFLAEPGTYRVEWQSPATSACLNERHPLLNVQTDSLGYEQGFGAIQNVCLLFGALGAGALLRAIVLWVAGIRKRRGSPRMMPELALRNVIPLRQHAPIPLISVLPDFRTAWFCIIGVLTVLFFLFAAGGMMHSNGLAVDFKGERTVIVERSPWAETMAVYVDSKRGFSVNGKSVAREELQSKLQEGLRRRGVWFVYFEADGDCLYMDALYAMDTIQGLGAKLIWITPKTREEWKKSSAPGYSDRANRMP